MSVTREEFDLLLNRVHEVELRLLQLDTEGPPSEELQPPGLDELPPRRKPHGLIHVELVRTESGWSGQLTDNGHINLEDIVVIDADGNRYTPDAEGRVQYGGGEQKDWVFHLERNGTLLKNSRFTLGKGQFSSHQVRINLMKPDTPSGPA